jgi:hypothetical protein
MIVRLVHLPGTGSSAKILKPAENSALVVEIQPGGAGYFGVNCIRKTREIWVQQSKYSAMW